MRPDLWSTNHGGPGLPVAESGLSGVHEDRHHRCSVVVCSILADSYQRIGSALRKRGSYAVREGRELVGSFAQRIGHDLACNAAEVSVETPPGQVEVGLQHQVLLGTHRLLALTGHAPLGGCFAP